MLSWQQVFNVLNLGDGMDNMKSCPHGEKHRAESDVPNALVAASFQLAECG
jgi:hypothetical protein